MRVRGSVKMFIPARLSEVLNADDKKRGRQKTPKHTETQIRQNKHGDKDKKQSSPLTLTES